MGRGYRRQVIDREFEDQINLAVETEINFYMGRFNHYLVHGEVDGEQGFPQM